MHPSQRELLAVLVRSARCPHPCDHMIGAPARARTADFLATTLYMRHRLHLISALVPLHTHTQRAASAPRLTVQCTHSMLPFPPAQLGALVTVVPSLITRPSPVQHLSPAPPSRGPRIRTVILNRPPHPSPHPLLKLEEAHSLDARQEILPCRISRRHDEGLPPHANPMLRPELPPAPPQPGALHQPHALRVAIYCGDISISPRLLAD